jgi:hypothetical protein
MAPEGSPHVALAQHGTEAAGLVIAAEHSVGHNREKSSVGNQLDDRVNRA